MIHTIYKHIAYLTIDHRLRYILLMLRTQLPRFRNRCLLPRSLQLLFVLLFLFLLAPFSNGFLILGVAGCQLDFDAGGGLHCEIEKLVSIVLWSGRLLNYNFSWISCRFYRRLIFIWLLVCEGAVEAEVLLNFILILFCNLSFLRWRWSKLALKT